mgnify:CR=1 FL=1
MAKYDGLSTAEISASISENLSSYEAARSGFFILVVDGLDDLLKPDYKGEAENAEDSDKIKKAQETLKLSVTKCPVPHFEIATNEYRRGNDVVKFAGVPTWNGGTITVADYVGLDTKSLLMSWLYKAYNPHTRKGGRMKDYKKTATLCEYTQDYELIRTWTIEGMFITKITEDDFDKENDGPRKLNVEFVFDRATVDLPDEE